MAAQSATENVKVDPFPASSHKDGVRRTI